jgi:hypothetical protein
LAYIAAQHYAFLVSEEGVDASLGRIRERGLTYWADPGQTRRDEINTRDGGRGLHFEDPDGHLLEILTRPYGCGNLTDGGLRRWWAGDALTTDTVAGLCRLRWAARASAPPRPTRSGPT